MLKKILKYTAKLSLIILQVPFHLVYFFSGFSRRNKNVWLFGCWGGTKFRGNSKFLFLHIKEKYPEIECIWITKNNAIYLELLDKRIDVCLAYSLKGILLTLRAKYFFVTHGILDVNQFVSRKGIMINLSHSIYPIKDMRKIPANTSLLVKTYLYLSEPYGYLINPNYAITSSDFTANATKHHYNITENHVVPTGTPKTDFLLSLNHSGLNRISFGKAIEFDINNKNLILFLPTVRPDRDFNLFNYNFDIDKLDKLLKKINGIFAFHLHPSQNKPKDTFNFKDYESIKFLNYPGDQINKLLSRTDILITDYSSIFADFLIFDRPLIFTKFNHNEYIKNKGLFIDYDNDLPGPKVETWPELIAEIKNIIINQYDGYQRQRNELKNLIYPKLDGKSCERIVRFAQSIAD